MYYYYYYFSDRTKKVTIDLKFEAEDPKAVSFEEFTDFLTAINQLHKRIIVLTQPEYKKNTPDDFDEITLLSYHQMDIVNVHRENPFFLKLTFNVLQSHGAPYWALWKVLIKICKRYGNDSKKLRETLESLQIFFEKIYDDLKVEALDNKPNDILGEPIGNESKENIYNDLKKSLRHFLQNKKTVEIYDSFCKTTIRITECFSFMEGIGEKIDLLND